MIFKKFSFLLVVRIVLMLGNMVLIAAIFGDERLIFNHVILISVLLLQIAELIRFVNKTNRSIARFLFAIKHDDISINLSEKHAGASFDELQNAFEEIMQTYKEAKTAKEANFHYLQHIIGHIKVGIISLQNESDISLINRPAERMLNATGVKNWKILGEKQPHFVQEIEKLGDEGKGLIEIKSNGETSTFSVDVSSMKLLDEQYKVITFQDIKSEIELKEIEAWHKLIRILTHEIMNSITPITSLTETMQSMLKDDSGEKSIDQLDDETIGDLLFSLSTIEKRSNGLLDFVQDYRQLTRVPQPNLELVKLSDFLSIISELMKPSLDRNEIKLTVSSAHENITAKFDKTLIEQILINLITNSKHALVDTQNPHIEIKAFHEDDKIIISISDNGSGIPEKELQEIFTPFFTTKEEGSGIGLSLSKQIMHLHKGRITVKSTVNEGTTFYLQFPI